MLQQVQHTMSPMRQPTTAVHLTRQNARAGWPLPYNEDKQEMGMTAPFRILQTEAFDKARSFKIVMEDNINARLPIKDFVCILFFSTNMDSQFLSLLFFNQDHVL